MKSGSPLTCFHHGIGRVYHFVVHDYVWYVVNFDPNIGNNPNGLLNEKSTIHRLNGVGYGGGNLNFCLNPYVIAFTLDL